MKSPRILWLFRQDSSVGSYRCRYPARALSAKGWDITFFEKPYNKALKPSAQEWFRDHVGHFDLIICDRFHAPQDLPYLAGLRHASPECRMIVDFDDDWANVPWWNKANVDYKPGLTSYETSRAHLKLSELATVSTPNLAKVMAPRTHAITVAENGIQVDEWADLPVDPQRAHDPHLRVLYGGASGHYGDLDDARTGLEAVLTKPPVPFRLICMGAVPHWLHDLAGQFPDRIVRLPWIPFEDYPQAVAWGGFDIAIAPLAEHPFNQSKSNIKWQEAAVQGIPLLCSNVGPYSEIPDGCAVRVANTAVQWSEGLRALLNDIEFREGTAARAKEAVLDRWTIERTLPQWEAAITMAMDRPRIEGLEDTRLPSEMVVAPEA